MVARPTFAHIEALGADEWLASPRPRSSLKPRMSHAAKPPRPPNGRGCPAAGKSGGRRGLEVRLAIVHAGYAPQGHPLIPFAEPREAFEEWRRVSRGRPCDYSGMTYELILEHGAIRWPCNEQHPTGSERLYEDLRFWTGIDEKRRSS